MHKTFIIGLIFNVPLHQKTAFLGPTSTETIRLIRDEAGILNLTELKYCIVNQ